MSMGCSCVSSNCMVTASNSTNMSDLVVSERWYLKSLMGIHHFPFKISIWVQYAAHPNITVCYWWYDILWYFIISRYIPYVIIFSSFLLHRVAPTCYRWIITNGGDSFHLASLFTHRSFPSKQGLCLKIGCGEKNKHCYIIIIYHHI